MANEPERPIEKLLRESARKRREESAQRPGFELHPATRRLLQGEVARRFASRGGSKKGAPWSWVGPFYPRLVEACVLVALVAVVASLLVPALRKPREQPMLAKNEERQVNRRAGGSATPSLQPAPPAGKAQLQPQAGTGLVASSDNWAARKDTPALRLESKPMELDRETLSVPGGLPLPTTGTLAQNALKLPDSSGRAAAPQLEPPALVASGAPAANSSALALASAPPPAAMPSAPSTAGARFALAENKPAEGLSNEVASSAGQFGFAYKALNGGVTGQPSSSLADASSVVARNYYAEGLKKEDRTGAARFTQVPSPDEAQRALQDQAKGPVLASFQVEQSGGALKVIDSDGSVYTGYLQASQPMRARSVDKVAPAAPTSSDALLQSGRAGTAETRTAGQTLRFFRVTGTNQSLRQKVVFSGTLSTLTNAVVSGKLGTGQAVGGAGGAAVPTTGPLQNYRINGQVIIGRGKPKALDAVPVP